MRKDAMLGSVRARDVLREMHPDKRSGSGRLVPSHVARGMPYRHGVGGRFEAVAPGAIGPMMLHGERVTVVAYLPEACTEDGAVTVESLWAGCWAVVTAEPTASTTSGRVTPVHVVVRVAASAPRPKSVKIQYLRRRGASSSDLVAATTDVATPTEPLPAEVVLPNQGHYNQGELVVRFAYSLKRPMAPTDPTAVNATPVPGSWDLEATTQVLTLDEVRGGATRHVFVPGRTSPVTVRTPALDDGAATTHTLPGAEHRFPGRGQTAQGSLILRFSSAQPRSGNHKNMS